MNPEMHIIILVIFAISVFFRDQVIFFMCDVQRQCLKYDFLQTKSVYVQNINHTLSVSWAHLQNM